MHSPGIPPASAGTDKISTCQDVCRVLASSMHKFEAEGHLEMLYTKRQRRSAVQCCHFYKPGMVLDTARQEPVLLSWCKSRPQTWKH